MTVDFEITVHEFEFIDGFPSGGSGAGLTESPSSAAWPILGVAISAVIIACLVNAAANFSHRKTCGIRHSLASLRNSVANVLKEPVQEEHRRQPHFRRKTFDIHDLPNELLAHIVVISIKHYPSILGLDPVDHLTAIRISHVSRRFRAVVLSIYLLRGTISTNMYPQWMKRALKNNKKQLLDVRCESKRTSSVVFSAASRRSTRWKKFSLVLGLGPHVENHPFLRSFSTLDPANLETLCIAYHNPTYSGYKTINDYEVPCYSQLRAPKLMHLEFLNFIPLSFSLQTARFGLTKLSFSFVSSWNSWIMETRDLSWNFATLLRFLEEMKTVTDLELELQVHNVDSSPLLPTELPHITKFSLRIAETIGEVVNPFLRALILPNLQALSFALAYSTNRCGDEEHNSLTQESCAVNLCLSALLHPKLGETQKPLQFVHLTDLALDVHVEPSFIRDNFGVPFHRMPKLERLHVRTNRNVLAPAPYLLQATPTGSIPLKELKLTDCKGMTKLSWLCTLSKYVNHGCLERVVVEGRLGGCGPCSPRVTESLAQIFSGEKIRLLDSKPDGGQGEDQFSYY